MRGRIAAFVAVAVILAAVFVRLGFWQLARLDERRALNAERAARVAMPIAPFDSVDADLRDRRVWLEGAFDFDREIVLAGRSRNGSPGVHLVTPLRRPGRDTAVLVNRGWVYSADAATVDRTRHRESIGRITGYTVELPDVSTTTSPPRGRSLRQLSSPAIASLIPYPVSPLYVISQDSSADTGPVRLPPPALDEGPHLSYAIQWFCFALISLGGAAVVLYRDFQGRATGSTAA